jgi:hypothetical protein
LIGFAHNSILDYFNIDGSRDLPTLRIINLETDMAKYKYESETIDEVSILSFVKSYVDGTLQVASCRWPFPVGPQAAGACHVWLTCPSASAT